MISQEDFEIEHRFTRAIESLEPSSVHIALSLYEELGLEVAMQPKYHALLQDFVRTLQIQTSDGKKFLPEEIAEMSETLFAVVGAIAAEREPESMKRLIEMARMRGGISPIILKIVLEKSAKDD